MNFIELTTLEKSRITVAVEKIACLQEHVKGCRVVLDVDRLLGEYICWDAYEEVSKKLTSVQKVDTVQKKLGRPKKSE